MSARIRGWLSAVVAVLVLSGLAMAGGVVLVPPAGPVVDPAGHLAGRPPPPSSMPAGGAGEPTPELSQGRAVRALLARRADAVRRRDEGAFLATVDPRATAEFMAAQRSLFAGLAGVPLAEWSYRIDDTQIARSPGRSDDDAVFWAPRTTLRYGLRGVDTVPTQRPLAYLYVRRDGQWYVSSDTELGPDADRTWRGPWDFGPCTTVPAPGGLVLGHPGQEELLAALAADLDDAVRAVTEVWGTEWSQQVAVLVPETLEEMRALVGPAFAVDGIAAAAVADLVDVGSRTAIGQRVVFNPVQVGRLSAASRRIVLRHEITHVAARASTVDGAPLWLLEGFADYIGYRGSGLGAREAAPDLVRVMRTGPAPDRLPTVADFGSADGTVDLTYQLAWSATLHVVDLVGEGGLVRLYRQLASSAAQDQTAIDAALREVLGLDLAGFEASWRDSLQSRFS